MRALITGGAGFIGSHLTDRLSARGGQGGRRGGGAGVFTGTNTVYGDLGGIELHRRGERDEPADDAVRDHGVSETQPLGFCGPSGCSKGAADQYVLDDARGDRIPGVVLRMSCIYGPHRCGNGDQGWVAHFVRRAIEGGAIGAVTA